MIKFIHSFLIERLIFGLRLNVLKVTVQFETEGSSQNEIVSHMDRSEVKL